MNNREFRDDLQEMWLRKLAGAEQSKISTKRDLIRLSGHVAAGCAAVIGVLTLSFMVVMG